MNDTSKDIAMALLTKHAINHDCLISVQTNLDGKMNKCFFKSTGDKTKLVNPDYCLGGDAQKEAIRKERKERVEKQRVQNMWSKTACENPAEIMKLSAQQILK
jgi:hypothetical protein